MHWKSSSIAYTKHSSDRSRAIRIFPKRSPHSIVFAVSLKVASFETMLAHHLFEALSLAVLANSLYIRDAPNDPTLATARAPVEVSSIDPAQLAANAASFAALNGTDDVTFKSFQRPNPNATTLAERSPDAGTSSALDKRTIYGPICSGGHTPPSRDDCAVLISRWNNFHQNRALSANSCDELDYGSCVTYICATRCNAITYDTDYVASSLQNIQTQCVVNQGEAGYIHSTGGTLGSGTTYARFEIGIERYDNELPPYEPC